MPADSSVHQVVVLYFLIGLAGTAIALFSANRRLQLATIALLLLPATLHFLSKSDLLSLGVATAAGIFFLSAVRSSKILSRAIKQNLKLKHSLMDANAEKDKLARVDELTGLFNRRAFYEYGELQSAQAGRSGDPLALLILDIDYFKRINDTYGHHIGDEALKHVSALLSASLRKTDVCGRMGGEEFAVLLPRTSLEQAKGVAEFLRERLANTPFHFPDGERPITASFGVTQNDVDINELLQQADLALYQAKSDGRDRVNTYSPDSAALETESASQESR